MSDSRSHNPGIGQRCSAGDGDGLWGGGHDVDGELFARRASGGGNTSPLLQPALDLSDEIHGRIVFEKDPILRQNPRPGSRDASELEFDVELASPPAGKDAGDACLLWRSLGEHPHAHVLQDVDGSFIDDRGRGGERLVGESHDAQVCHRRNLPTQPPFWLQSANPLVQRVIALRGKGRHSKLRAALVEKANSLIVSMLSSCYEITGRGAASEAIVLGKELPCDVGRNQQEMHPRQSSRGGAE